MEQQQVVSIGHQLAGRLAWKMVAGPQHKKYSMYVLPLHSTGKGTLSKPAGACAGASQAGALPFVASASPSILWVVGWL